MAQPQVTGEKRGRGRPAKVSGPVTNKSAYPDAPATVEYAGKIIQLPSFGFNTMRIYFWPYPYPTSFVQLTDHFRRWKDNKDAEEKAEDFDDGADDWDAFAGPFDLEGDNKDIFRWAASVFVKQAKRAFWAGKTWEEYESEQLQAKTDEVELPNKVRLAIYHGLKIRLCEEIWSQQYPEAAAQDSKIPSPEVDEARARPGNAPAVASGSGGGNGHVAPLPKRPRVESPTTEQAAKGITGIATDRLGMRQPLYKDETEPPNMDRDLADDRKEMARDREQIQRGNRSPHRMTDELQHASFNGVPLWKDQSAPPPFELAMRQAQQEMESSSEEDVATDDGT